MDTYNRGLEKSIASFDRTHVLVFSWTYELPFGPGKRFLGQTNPIVKQLVGGWQLNAIHRYQSGTPIAVSGGSDLSQLFGGGNRPNWISNDVRTAVSMGNFDPARDIYLNIGAFSQPAPFTFGNAPPRLPNVRSPAFYNEDFSVFKKFYLASESRYLEFRTELFNVSESRGVWQSFVEYQQSNHVWNDLLPGEPAPSNSVWVEIHLLKRWKFEVFKSRLVARGLPTGLASKRRSAQSFGNSRTPCAEGLKTLTGTVLI